MHLILSPKFQARIFNSLLIISYMSTGLSEFTNPNELIVVPSNPLSCCVSEGHRHSPIIQADNRGVLLASSSSHATTSNQLPCPVNSASAAPLEIVCSAPFLVHNLIISH